MKPRAIIWSIKDLVGVLKVRQLNEFDGNIAVTGDRGNGKSTVISKILYRFNCFSPWKHQVYSRNDVMKLLTSQIKGVCWDDEAVNTSYKRDFQNKGQQELIKYLTAYRDNYNIFASAIPNFFSLDKDLRDLYFLHLHVIERGIAVVHMPVQGRLYSQDRWDAKYNSKIEESWGKKIIKNPKFKPPYHKLTTFRGYLYFNKLTKAQEKLYKLIKKEKRKTAFGEEKHQDPEKTFFEKVYQKLMTKEMTKDFLMQYCLMEGRKYSSVISQLNTMLKDNGILKYSVKDFLVTTKTNLIHSKEQIEIKKLLPNF